MTQHHVAVRKNNRIYLTPTPDPYRAVAKTLDKALQFERPGKEYMGDARWAIVHLYSTKTGSFPHGLLGRAKNALKRLEPMGFTFDWSQVESNPIVPKHNIDAERLRPYQIKAIGHLIQNRGGILELPTGAGKTTTAIEFLRMVDTSALVVVHTKDLKEQWERELARFGVKAAVGLYQNKATADSYRYARVVVFDECHHVAAKTLYKLASRTLPDQVVVGLSATPYRTDGMEMLIEAALGPTVFSVTRAELIARGYLAPAKVVFMQPSFDATYPLTYAHAYDYHIVDNPSRNDMVVYCAEQLTAQGRKVLILVQKISHGKALETMCATRWMRTKFIHGSSKDRSADFDNLDVVIASQVFNEGVDFPKANALIIAGGGASSIRVTQQAGRVLRLSEGKTDAIIVDFDDTPKWLRRHAKARREVLEKDFEVVTWQQVVATPSDDSGSI